MTRFAKGLLAQRTAWDAREEAAFSSSFVSVWLSQSRPIEQGIHARLLRDPQTELLRSRKRKTLCMVVPNDGPLSSGAFSRVRMVRHLGPDQPGCRLQGRRCGRIQRAFFIKTEGSLAPCAASSVTVILDGVIAASGRGIGFVSNSKASLRSLPCQKESPLLDFHR